MSQPASRPRHPATLPLLLAAVSIFVATAQAQPGSYQFEVVSIRPSRPGNQPPILRPTLDGIRATNCTLLMFAAFAYGPTEPRLGNHGFTGAPGWADTDLFDLSAKVSDADAEILRKLDPNARERMLSLMMRRLLTDRFQLAAHREPRELPVYDLVVAKGGPRLPKSSIVDPELPNGALRMADGTINGTGISTARLAEALTAQVERPVRDATGLSGRYTVTLKWQPEGKAGPEANHPTPPDAASGPSIFTALQEQLGLRLMPGKGRADVIVLDHVSKPSEN